MPFFIGLALTVTNPNLNVILLLKIQTISSSSLRLHTSGTTIEEPLQNGQEMIK